MTELAAPSPNARYVDVPAGEFRANIEQPAVVELHMIQNGDEDQRTASVITIPNASAIMRSVPINGVPPGGYWMTQEHNLATGGASVRLVPVPDSRAGSTQPTQPVDVEIPAQAPTVIAVCISAYGPAAPDVNVAAPNVQVDVAAPNVTVNVPTARAIQFVRDKNGKIAGAITEELSA